MREVDEGATHGMNVQSLHQHNHATASVHVGPSEPDNHLHLHHMNSTLSCMLIAPHYLPFVFFFSQNFSCSLGGCTPSFLFPNSYTIHDGFINILFFALPPLSIFSPTPILCLATLWRIQQNTQTCF
jgi:hypothetical protein